MGNLRISNLHFSYDDKEVFKDRFMIAYYTYLYKEFSKKNPIVRNGEGFYELIEDIIALEDIFAVSESIDPIEHDILKHEIKLYVFDPNLIHYTSCYCCQILISI